MPDFTVRTYQGGGMNKTAVLAAGDTDTMLVDATFTLADAHRVAAEILDSGKNLTTIYVSHGDPDYYFGLQVLSAAFPRARIVGTQATVDHVKATYEGKLRTWGPALGANLPGEVIVPRVQSGPLQIEGQDFEIKGPHPDLPEHTYLWQPTTRTILGGVLLFGGMHTWLADTAQASQRAAWADMLSGMRDLRPAMVIPGHRTAESPLDASIITENLDYLQAFEAELPVQQDGAALAARMKELFPKLAAEGNADLGAKVIKGEMAWG